MRAIEGRRPAKTQRIPVVKSGVDEVLIASRWTGGRRAARIGEPGKRISELKVQVLHSAKGILDVVDQFHIHGVVNRAANREQEYGGADRGVDSGESAIKAQRAEAPTHA